jgi:hypothetical protein
LRRHKSLFLLMIVKSSYIFRFLIALENNTAAQKYKFKGVPGTQVSLFLKLRLVERRTLLDVHKWD